MVQADVIVKRRSNLALPKAPMPCCVRSTSRLILNPIGDELDHFLAPALLDENGVVLDFLKLPLGDLDA